MNRGAVIAAFFAIAGTLRQTSSAALPRVAITVEQDGSIDSASVARLTTKISSGLIKQNHFQVVERAKLQAVKQEQGFSNSSYSDPKTAAALGRILGVSRILHIAVSAEASSSAGVYINTYAIDVSASFTMIGVDTARVLAAGTASGNVQKQFSSSGGSVSESALRREAVDACADDLITQLNGSLAK